MQCARQFARAQRSLCPLAGAAPSLVGGRSLVVGRQLLPQPAKVLGGYGARSFRATPFRSDEEPLPAPR